MAKSTFICYCCYGFTGRLSKLLPILRVILSYIGYRWKIHKTNTIYMKVYCKSCLMQVEEDCMQS